MPTTPGLPGLPPGDEPDEDEDLDDDEDGDIPFFEEPFDLGDDDGDEDPVEDDEDDDLDPVPELAVDSLHGDIDDPIEDDEIPGVMEDLDPGDDGYDDVDGLAILPWRAPARLPDLGRDLEAELDPTLARTEWHGAARSDRFTTTVVVGPIAAVVEVECLEGEGPSRLRVGRDVLGGRALIRP